MVNVVAEQLLGDKVEAALKKVKADKIAAAVSKMTKKPCGCGKRKQQLNDLHKRITGKDPITE